MKPKHRNKRIPVLLLALIFASMLNIAGFQKNRQNRVQVTPNGEVKEERAKEYHSFNVVSLDRNSEKLAKEAAVTREATNDED